MTRYYALWNEEDRTRIASWWYTITGTSSDHGRPSMRGVRATVRRCSTVEDVLLTEGFRMLYHGLGTSVWTRDANVPGLAAVVGVLAHIDANVTDTSFAEQCAVRAKANDRPLVSELRFAQLQKSRTIDELYTRMRRTVLLLRRTTNILSAADGILQWYREHELDSKESKLRDRVLVRWGLEYFRH